MGLVPSSKWLKDAVLLSYEDPEDPEDERLDLTSESVNTLISCLVISIFLKFICSIDETHMPVSKHGDMHLIPQTYTLILRPDTHRQTTPTPMNTHTQSHTLIHTQTYVFNLTRSLTYISFKFFKNLFTNNAI